MNSPESESNSDLDQTFWNCSTTENTVIEVDVVSDNGPRQEEVDSIFKELLAITPGKVADKMTTCNDDIRSNEEPRENTETSHVSVSQELLQENKADTPLPDNESGESSSLNYSGHATRFKVDNSECNASDTLSPLLSFKTPLTSRISGTLLAKKILRWHDKLILSPSEILSPFRRTPSSLVKFAGKSIFLEKTELGESYSTERNKGFCETKNEEKADTHITDIIASEENSFVISPQVFETEERDSFGVLHSLTPPVSELFPDSPFLCRAPRKRSSSLQPMSSCKDGSWFGPVIASPPEYANISNLTVKSIPFDQFEEDECEDFLNLSCVSSKLDKAFIEEDEEDPIQATFSLLAHIIDDMHRANDGKKLSVTLPPELKKKRKLSKLQLFGVRWAIWREEQFPGGGILVEHKNLNKAAIIAGFIMKSKESSDSPVEADDGISTHSTLLVCPKNCLKEWETDIRSVLGNGSSIYIHHGAKRTINPKKLTSYDVVLTTYTTISAENPKGRKCLHPSPLNQVHWERIVLDNAGMIRNSKTVSTQVILYNLKGKHRWAVLTESPREDTPQDLFNLVKFLQLSPFDEDDVWENLFGKKMLKTDESLQRMAIIKSCLMLPQD